MINRIFVGSLLVHDLIKFLFLEIIKFALIYTNKKMEEMRAGGGQFDRDAWQAARQKMTDERDAKLKGLLTDAQLKTWKDEIEPSMRPQRGGGNRGGGGGN